MKKSNIKTESIADNEQTHVVTVHDSYMDNRNNPSDNSDIIPG